MAVDRLNLHMSIYLRCVYSCLVAYAIVNDRHDAHVWQPCIDQAAAAAAGPSAPATRAGMPACQAIEYTMHHLGLRTEMPNHHRFSSYVYIIGHLHSAFES